MHIILIGFIVGIAYAMFNSKLKQINANTKWMQEETARILNSMENAQ